MSSTRIRGSCPHGMHNGNHHISRERRFPGITTFLTVLLATLAMLGTVFARKHSIATAAYILALRDHTNTTTNVVHAATTVIHTQRATRSSAIVHATITVTHTATPTHTSAVVYSRFGAGAIVGLCFAVIGGISLAIILLFCVARFLVKRIERLIGAGKHPVGNSCDERHSARACSAGGQAGNYCLGDLSGGGHSAGDNSAGYYSAGDEFAGK